ncbi:MAG: glycogen synthase GlgA [Clostridia bacterium]|nr:glycogen synthase GlgA [Clostridia bacterium]MBQ2939980.1 glycogen synthase GlgA [Clostridia bacterium]
MKVLYVASEALPFIASGGLADVAGSLPKELRRRLCGCRVVLPLYEAIPQTMREQMTFLTSFSVPVAWRRQYCGVFEAKVDGVIYYLLDNQYYFKRAGLYGHYDDAERFAFFSRAVLEMLKQINFQPDVIHANDWQSALVPVYLSLYYAHDPFYSGIKTLFTIHNIQYQGQYGMDILEDVFGIPKDRASIVEMGGCVNLMKGAIETSHRVSTVSPTYAEEILDPWFAHGMNDMLEARKWKLSGILNGIDIDGYNPETDKNLAVNYTREDRTGKVTCKSALQEEMGLPKAADRPVIGMVTRLVSHKGLDLVKARIEQLLSETDAQLVVLGSGDWSYENFFRDLQSRYADRVAYRAGFIPALARRIYAGADIFLMPSQSEPCGLAQMVACRYGTIPVVRETGGLKDSIHDAGDGEGNGFTFQTYNADDMLDALRRSVAAYHSADWPSIIDRAMDSDFSWGRSANEYLRLYRAMIKE